jgi:hypothetical protein
MIPSDLEHDHWHVCQRGLDFGEVLAEHLDAVNMLAVQPHALPCGMAMRFFANALSWLMRTACRSSA